MLRTGMTAWRRYPMWIAPSVAALLVLAPTGASPQAAKKPTPPPAQRSGTVERIKKTGSLKLGYRSDAVPFSFKDQSGNPSGYSVQLCQALSDAIKSELALPDLKVEWVPLTVENRIEAVQRHEVDAECGAVTSTLERRKQVSFSSPIFPGGVGVVVRSDAPARLRNILAGGAKNYSPTWRAVALNILREQIFATLPATTAEQFLQQRGRELDVEARVTPVSSYEAGLQAVNSRQANAFFAERAILLESVKDNPAYKKLEVIDRQFTYEPLALILPRDDEDFRLLVDTGLSQIYNSPGFAAMYSKWFGEPSKETVTFFRWSAAPK
jgi:ABC-type amino acid transport substrate-binding protein